MTDYQNVFPTDNGSYQAMTQEVFQSYTGTDINATISVRTASGAKKTKLIGTLASITVSTVREVAPLYVMGRTNYVTVAKGKRSISGTMVFTVFDRDPLVRDIIDPSDLAELKSQWSALSSLASSTAGTGFQLSSEMSKIMQSMEAQIQATQSLRAVVGQQAIQYPDQLAPFDVTLSFVNDQGSGSVAAVRQISVISSGWGASMHDMESDQVFQYIAREYVPLTSLNTGRNSNTTTGWA